MKIKEHGAVRAEYVFIPRDFLLPVFCVIQQEMVPSTKELTVMILLSIFQDIMVSCRGNIRISNLFVEQFHHNTSLALNKG
jgi:hypothetical protein